MLSPWKYKQAKWYIVRNILAYAPDMTDEEIASIINTHFGFELDKQLLADAKYIYNKLVSSGKLAPEEGFADLAMAKGIWFRLSADDRIRFKNWVSSQFLKERE